MILCAHRTWRPREQSTKRTSRSENMWKVCLFYSQNYQIEWLSNVADTFFEKFKKCTKACGSLFSWLCFMDADWLWRKTPITWDKRDGNGLMQGTVEEDTNTAFHIGLFTGSLWATREIQLVSVGPIHNCIPIWPSRIQRMIRVICVAIWKNKRSWRDKHLYACFVRSEAASWQNSVDILTLKIMHGTKDMHAV